MNKMNKEEEDKIELDALLGRLRPFQKEAFNFATGGSLKPIDENTSKSRGRILLADEMGLGKTVTSLAIMLAYKSEWPLLILCPASLRYTWPAEIEKFCPKLPHSAVYVVRGFDDCDFHSNPNKRANIKIVVATYSLLQNRSAAARALQQFNFRCVIADESHNFKEKKSQRCTLAMPILLKANRLLLLSGTPALARPVELWAQLHCINKDLFGAYSNFTKRYCNARYGRFGWDCTGLSNADELHEKLKTVMIRRLKCDVLSELPPKQRCIIPVKIQKSKHVKECKDIISRLNETRLAVDSLVGDDASNANFEARSLLMQAYKASGCGKAQAVADYVVDWLRGSGTQKVLVFAHHKEVLDTIEEAVSKALKGVGHIRIDGSVNPADRASRVKKFQNKPQVRLALLSVTAAGVGLTLTAASSVIFAELHWTPGVLAQAEDRCHRIGQTNVVNIMFCVCKETDMSVDLSLWKMLGRKVNNLGRMIDGERGTGMNATEAENNAPADQELSSFFADTLPGDAMPGKLNALVKGSIQSFFKKPSPDLATSRNALPTTINTKTVGREVTPEATKGQKRPFTSSPSSSCTISTSWNCKMCTYINETNSLACEMCGATTRTGTKKRAAQTSFGTVNLTRQTSFSMKNKNGASPVDRSPEVIEIRNGDALLYDRKPLVLKALAGTMSPSQSSIIEIIDDSDDEIIEIVETTQIRPNKKFKRKQENDLNNNPNTGSNEVNLLSFSVSKNSGRIAVHNSFNGESLLINFDVDQIVIDNDDSEDFTNRQLKRCTSGRSAPQVEFENLAVESVAREIIESNLVGGSLRMFCSEIKLFVSNYAALREVEKKSIRELGLPIQCTSVHDTIRKIINSKVQPQSTERYVGGSFERALEKAAELNADEADRKVLDGNACAWCGGNLPDVSFCKGVQSTYCSQECADEGRIRRGGIYASTRIRTQVFSLEHGICQVCGIDANALFLRIKALQPAQRLSALMGANWRLPKTSTSVSKLLQHPKESHFWEADHIQAVSEGGGGCGLENLRTLCTPCHQVETERLRSRLKLRSIDHEDEAANVTDIRRFLS